jgi:aminoglycoside phosphotransferase (APT) family kinase protein
VPVHDAAAEVAVLERWTGELAAHAGAGSPADAAARRAREALPRVAAALLDGPAGPLVAVHRDLHDKQLLVGDDGAVGLLDFDTLAAGEAALDVANLLVHLELRALQDACAPAVARAAANALLDAYAPGDALRARVRAYAQATRLRLACLYAVRPGPPGLVGELLSRLTPVPAAPRRAAGSRPAAPTR